MSNSRPSLPPDSRDLLAAIVESSDDAIISKDLNSIVTSWNRSAERIFGYTADEMIGKSITLLIPPERIAEEASILDRIRRGLNIEHFETVRVTKTGRKLEVSLSISPVRDIAGRIVGASKILRDITDRKLVERELEMARAKLASRADDLEKRVSERTAQLREMVAELEGFSYSISHDLRAPLRSIQQYSEILAEEYRDQLDDEGRKFLTRIAQSVMRLDALIRDVLTYSRVVRAELVMTHVNTGKLVEGIMEAYPHFQPPHADLQIQHPLLPVKAHEPFLLQCLANLLGNAVKFVAPGVHPRVVVRTEQRGDRVRIWIEDNGIGIASEQLNRIFGMFERGTANPTYEGTGIGLSIVRKAVERMNGTLGVESAPGGTRFWIEFAQAA